MFAKQPLRGEAMRYRIFGNTGLRVSTLALGTGNFGNGWGYGADKEEARNIYTRYREAGGNFIDTADQYQFGQSETMLSDFIATERDDIVLATKFSLGDSPEAGLQRSGNSRKSMVNSLEASLKRLKTDHIDLLWVHMPDGVTPVDQIARALDDLIRSGKILYAGLSDFPAWRVATAATVDAVLAIADETGYPPGQIAIAWVLAKGTLPIIGPRTAEQLADNLASVNVQLTGEQLYTPGRRKRNFAWFPA